MTPSPSTSPESGPAAVAARAPLQSRSVRTRQALIDALDRLLRQKSFATITVAEIADEAGLSTGAIYRRFEHKEDLLRAAFVQFEEQAAVRTLSRDDEARDLTDIEVVRYVVTGFLEYILEYRSLMRAASSLDDAPSFEKMRTARAEVAEWLSERLTTMPLEGHERTRRVRFALRAVTAVIRDTFLAGPGASAVEDANPNTVEHLQTSLIDDLTDLVVAYLQLTTDEHRT